MTHFKHFTRRDFTQGLALGAAAIAMPTWSVHVQAAQIRASEIHVQNIRGDCYLLALPYANVLALSNDDGLLVVDGVRGEDSEAFLQRASAFSGGTPEIAYNTHWHWDHTGSNAALRAAGTTLIAHENTRLWLSNDFYVDWLDRQHEPAPPEALPDETFYTGHQLSFGGETLNSALLFQAHTDGDIYVHLQEHNILAVGDLVSDGKFPLVDPVTGGWIGGLVEAQARLLELADEETLIIPGSGRVLNRAELNREYAMLNEMKARIFEFARQGKGPREMLAEDIAAGFEEWGDPERFVMNAYPGLGRHYREVDGVV